MDENAALENFSALTQVPKTVAKEILERNNWNVQQALEDFYNGPTQRSSPSPQPQGTQSNASSAQKKATQKKATPKFKSFQQLVNSQEEEENDEQNFFAGGGRGSGINVENPNNANRLVQDLLKKAESDAGAAGGEFDDEPQVPKFSGSGYRLGDSTTPSQKIGSTAPKKLEKAHREITFWKDGFQVGEGKLYRYDDPANSHYLNELNAGRAPLSLLDVEFGQEVVVNVMKKLDEEYKPPKRTVGGFHGQGHRLGSPVSPDYVASQPQSREETPKVEEQSKPAEAEAQGDSQVQVRLADGRRVIRRVNSSDPVQVLFDFVATQTDSLKGWNLNYAFPVKPIEDKSKSIKELGLVNAVVVQRWV